MKKGSKLDPRTPRAMKHRLRQLMEAGNTTAQAAHRLGISNKEVLALLSEMHAADSRVEAATVPTTATVTKDENGKPKHVTLTSLANERTRLDKYRTVCRDILAVLDIESMSEESRENLVRVLMTEMPR